MHKEIWDTCPIFVWRIIEALFPRRSLVTHVSNGKLYHDSVEGSRLTYDKIKLLSSRKAMTKAYTMHFLMTMCGQRGCNLMIYKKKIYCHWTTFSKDDAPARSHHIAVTFLRSNRKIIDEISFDMREKGELSLECEKILNSISS